MRIYAIQVGSGQEAKVEELIRRFIDESMIGEIFVPRFESMRRWKGEWHKRTERLRLIGQKVCLDRTHVPLMLIQPEREGVLAMEFFPDSPVAPFRLTIALLRG